MGHHEAQRLHQPRRLAEQPLALAHRVAGQPPLALGDVAQATMDHLRRATRGAPGEVPLLQQQAAPAAPRGFAEDAGTADAAADHDQVPLLPRQRRQAAATPLLVPG
ncbi:hypothetical protein Z046_10895 [Pseudomonas aeruginosa VRFPA09]|nr:hypothetical protein Z046_10895 [Pseudomonas aeruginosa VRFPA09]